MWYTAKITSFPVFVPSEIPLCNNSVKTWRLFPLSLNLGWPCDLLWPKEWSVSDSMSVSSQGLKWPCISTCSHGALSGPHVVNKLGWWRMRDTQSWIGQVSQLRPSLTSKPQDNRAADHRHMAEPSQNLKNFLSSAQIPNPQNCKLSKLF